MRANPLLVAKIINQNRRCVVLFWALQPWWLGQLMVRWLKHEINSLELWRALQHHGRMCRWNDWCSLGCMCACAHVRRQRELAKSNWDDNSVSDPTLTDPFDTRKHTTRFVFIIRREQRPPAAGTCANKRAHIRRSCLSSSPSIDDSFRVDAPHNPFTVKLDGRRGW